MEARPLPTPRPPNIRIQTSFPIMPSPQQGLLDGSKDWDEIETELQEDGLLGQRRVEYSPYWKPVASVYHRSRRILSPSQALRFWGSSRPSHTKKLRPTAYLDGLRGFAAFLVYFHHHQLWAHSRSGQAGIFENGFGYDGHYDIVTFPVIRHFFTGGHFAVSTFFVISGYVLSLKSLHLIQSGDTLQLGDHISSALFRRWLRLYLPVLATLVIYVTILHSFGGIWTGSGGVTKQNTWREELWRLYCEFKNFSFVFNAGGDPFFPYNTHLWSIPVEFKGSLVVYTSLLAFSRCTRNARLWCELALMGYFMYIADGAHYSMFMAGMLICDLERLAEREELPRFLVRVAPYKEVIFYHLFVISMLLGGVPSETREIEQLRKTRGWNILSYLHPQAVFDYKWFYLFWAASFLVACIPKMPWLKRFFETKFCQHLGYLSFSLYMVHGPILCVLGERLYVAAGWIGDEAREAIPWWVDRFPLPRVGPLGLELSFWLPHVILLPVTLLAAEIVTRGVDTPSVRFASWVYRQLLGDSLGSPAKTKA